MTVHQKTLHESLSESYNSCMLLMSIHNHKDAEFLVVKIEQDTDKLKHHQVFSIANIQDEAQRRKQGVQMHQRKLCIMNHMI